MPTEPVEATKPRDAKIPSEPGAWAASSDERYRILFETATESIILIGPDGLVLDANPAVAAFLGRSIQDTVGRSVWEVAHTENPELLQGLLRTFLDGKPVPDPIYFAMFDSSGRRREVVIRARLILARDAPPTVAIIGRDITEERVSERMALENERLAALGRVTAFIAHDLVTPLTNIALLTAAAARDA